MNLDDMQKRLAEVFVDVLDKDGIDLSRETTAADIAEWDSLAHVSLLVAIEKEFNIHFSLAEAESLRNVGDMMDLIQQKVS